MSYDYPQLAADIIANLPADATPADARRALQNVTALDHTAALATTASISAATDTRLDAVEAKVEEVVVAGSGGALIDDAALVQTAVNAYAYERTVVLEGNFDFSGRPVVDIPDGGWIRGRSGATITKPSSDNTNVFQAQGLLGADVNLTANATAGSTTLTFNTAGIAVGDILLLRSNADWSPFEVNAPQGEQVQVRSITDSGHLETQAPLMDNYTTANTARVAKITHRRDVQLKGVRRLNPSFGSGNSSLLNARYTRNLTIENVIAEKMTGASLYLESGLGTRVSGASFLDGYTREDGGSGAYGYGINLAGATQGAAIDDVTGHNGRTLITTNGTPRGGVPRNCTINGCTAGGRYSVSPFHAHYVAEGIHYSDCTGTGTMGTGLFHIAGKGCSVSDPGGERILGHGVYIDTSALGTVISGGMFRNMAGGTGTAAIWDTGSNTTVSGTLVDTCANVAAYTEGGNFTWVGGLIRPGTTKTAIVINDASNTYHVDTTIIDANVGVSVLAPASATPRVILRHYNVTTPCSQVAALISRTIIGTGETWLQKNNMRLYGGVAASGGVKFSDGGDISGYGGGTFLTGNVTTTGAYYLGGGAQDSYVKRAAAGKVNIQKLCVENRAAATEVIGKAVQGKMEVFDAAGVSLGFVPLYSSIT